MKKIKKNFNNYKGVDIGCGQRKQENFFGIDYTNYPGVDLVWNVEKTPWPIPKESFHIALASHLVEHIDPHGGVFLRFMDEVWRVLKYGGEFMIAVPYAGSHGYWQDPTHCNPCNESTWDYFDPLKPSALYTIYRPKPWEVKHLSWKSYGNMEVVLEKRRIDKSYGHEEGHI